MYIQNVWTHVYTEHMLNTCQKNLWRVISSFDMCPKYVLYIHVSSICCICSVYTCVQHMLHMFCIYMCPTYVPSHILEHMLDTCQKNLWHATRCFDMCPTYVLYIHVSNICSVYTRVQRVLHMFCIYMCPTYVPYHILDHILDACPTYMVEHMLDTIPI